MHQTRTKIICTLGPRGTDPEFIRKLAKAGMNVVRLNFSHMSPTEALPMVQALKQVREELGMSLAIMIDTRGPEVRMYGYTEPVSVAEGDRIVVRSYTGDDIATVVSQDGFLTNLANIGTFAQLGGRVLLMDGMVEGKIVDKDDTSITIEILNPAELRVKAHLTLPKTDYPLPFLSNKDIEDIQFAVRENLEFIALSFVRCAEDIFRVRNLIRETDESSKIKLIAKIEAPRAVDNLSQIIRYSDGVMVARGDLAVELDLEDVPVMQKRIIEDSYLAGKPVITATQMLESMIESRFPTRAEVSDVANACYDMTSAVMLSGETAIGKYPDLVVSVMRRIIDRVETSYDYERVFHQRSSLFQSRDLTTIISYNAVSTAFQSKAAAILVFTKTGYSARMISKLRPNLPIHAFTPDPTVYQQLSLSWGVFPHTIDETDDFEAMMKLAIDYCVQQGYLNKGELVVMVAGLPMGTSGRTNMIRIESVGKSRIPVKVAHPGNVTAPAVHVCTDADINTKDLSGKILLLKSFKVEYTTFLRYAAGIVAENDDAEEDLRVLGIACNVPVFVNARAALDQIAEGTMMQMDSTQELLLEI